jgi:uncharacterized DUF497 family protein
MRATGENIFKKDNHIRIISARPSTRREQEQYEEGFDETAN